MNPVSPVIRGEDLKETNFGENQEEFRNLPAVVFEDGTATSRWKCSIIDRLRLLLFGNVYVSQILINDCITPIDLQTRKPKIIRMFSFGRKWKDWFKYAFCLDRELGWIKTPRGWLCWDFSNPQHPKIPRIYWSRDATPRPEAGVRVFLR